MDSYILYYRNTSFLKSAIVLFVISTLLKIILMPFGGFLIDIFNLKDFIYTAAAQIPEISYEDFLVGILIAPFIETIIGQYLPLSMLSKFNFSNTYKVIISGLFFSLLHLPVVEFLPSAFGVGVCLSIGFLSRYKYKNNLKEALILTYCIHFLHNLFAFLVVYIFANY